MASQIIQMVHKEDAETELRSIRQNCDKWSVNDNIRNMREHLARAGLSLADIGTSEEELQACFKTGHKRSAQNWMQVAKDCCNERDVSFEIERIRNRLVEADLNLSDIDSSEADISRLLLAHKVSRKFDGSGLIGRSEFGKRKKEHLVH